MNPLVDHLPALQVVVPMLVAPLVVLLRPRGLAWAACTMASVLAFVIAIQLVQGVLAGGPASYLMGSWPAPYGIELKVDAFSALLLLVVTGASVFTLVGGRESLDSANRCGAPAVFLRGMDAGARRVVRHRGCRRCVQYLRFHGGFVARELRVDRGRSGPAGSAFGIQVPGHGHDRRDVLPHRCRTHLHDDRNAQPRRHGTPDTYRRGPASNPCSGRLYYRRPCVEGGDIPSACLVAECLHLRTATW